MKIIPDGFNKVSKTIKSSVVRRTKRMVEIIEAQKSCWNVLGITTYFKLWLDEGSVFPPTLVGRHEKDTNKE